MQVDMHALQRFVENLDSLRAALAAPMTTTYDLQLRGEIRRNALALSGALDVAADEEPNRVRAAVFRAASVVAADLASVPPLPAGATEH